MTQPDLAALRSGTPEADATVARAMGWVQRTTEAGTLWWEDQHGNSKPRPLPSFTSSSWWVGPMLLRLGELVRAMGWSLTITQSDDETWHVCADFYPYSSQREPGTFAHGMGALQEATWRVLVAVAERRKNDGEISQETDHR